MSPLPAAVAIAGLALVAVSLSWQRRQRLAQLAELLEVDLHPQPEPGEPAPTNPVIEGAVQLADKAMGRLDAKGGLTSALERARIPMRAGEFAIVSLALGFTLGAFLFAVTRAAWLTVLPVALSPAIAAFLVRRRITKRTRAFEAQLPGALTLVASSLAAGHTFLRAIQMMCEESEPPLAEEFSRVVVETRLGDPLVDALGRMADRLQIRDVDWVVQAIRIQQSVGGRLADLLHTLADFIRARDEVRREVLVLTAEGRISAWVLGGLPVFLLATIQVINPAYMKPMYRGWGLAVLLGCACSVVFGTVLISRMSKIEV